MHGQVCIFAFDTSVSIICDLPAKRVLARAASAVYMLVVERRQRCALAVPGTTNAEAQRFSRCVTAVGLLPLLFVSNDVQLDLIDARQNIASPVTDNDSQSGDGGAPEPTASLATLMQRCQRNVTVDGCVPCTCCLARLRPPLYVMCFSWQATAAIGRKEGFCSARLWSAVSSFGSEVTFSRSHS